MSKTTVALLVKLAATFISALIAFSMVERNAPGTVFLLAVLGTVLNYVLGDLVILNNTSNLVASIADGGVSAVTAYIFDLIIPAFVTTATSIVLFAVIVAVFEYFFHQYLLRSTKVAP
ncbi:MAG: DUF2512 family protein [Ignavibacteriales bacterium]